MKKKKLIKRMLLFKDGLLIDHRPLGHEDVTGEWKELEVDCTGTSFNEFIQNRNMHEDGTISEPNPKPIKKKKSQLEKLLSLMGKTMEDYENA